MRQALGTVWVGPGPPLGLSHCEDSWWMKGCSPGPIRTGAQQAPSVGMKVQRRRQQSVGGVRCPLTVRTATPAVPRGAFLTLQGGITLPSEGWVDGHRSWALMVRSPSAWDTTGPPYFDFPLSACETFLGL